MGLAATLAMTGCGNQYRPVVSAINPVGPAGQPTKYAVAVSNTSTAPSQVPISGYSITSDVATFTVAAPSNAFTAGQSVTLSGFPTSTFLNGLVVTVLPTGLTSTKFEANVNNANTSATEAGLATVPGATLPGLLTFVDSSGDTIVSTPSILPFPPPTTAGTATTAPTPTYINPLNFTLELSAFEGFVVNSSGTYNQFPTSNPSTLLTQNIVQTTLASDAVPSGIETFSLPTTGTTLFIPQPDLAQIAELEVTTGPSLLQNLTVQNPVYVVGTDSAQRVYALGSNGTGNGTAYPIENSPVSIDSGNLIPVGVNPVYGVMTADGNRAFVLNEGSGSISVINVPSNTLDSGAPTIPTLAITSYSINGNVATFNTSIPPRSLAAGETVTLNGFATSTFLNGQVVTVSATGLTTTQFQAALSHTNVATTVEPGVAVVPLANPVWADLSTINSELVVLNHGAPGQPGSLSIINIPLCNINTPVTNPNCNVTNPIDAMGFGTLVATVPVGINPTMVSVLADGTQAYVVNSGTLPSGTSPGVEGSVSIVNLINDQVTTIAATSLPSATVDVATTPNEVYGHPNTVAATTGTPTGKVYVTSSDNKYMTIIDTDTNMVDTHVSLQGLGIRVLVTAK